MIPRQITIKGFLSYRDQETACFAGQSLWMLTGANGSGKSTLFDAVSFALYNRHRGGGKDHQELINKDSDQLLVEFEFELNETVYKARRTRTRAGSATRAILQLQDSGDWREVEGTSSEGGLTAWVETQLGLDYSTFTLSVLLLQGRSNELLEKRPADRHKALGEIVGLARYEAWHQQAGEQRRQFKAETESLGRRLQELPVITAEQIATQEQAAVGQETDLRQQTAAVEQTEACLQQSRLWAEYQSQLERLTQEEIELADILRDDEQIRAEYAEHQLLQQALPVLAEWMAGERERCSLADGTRQFQQQHAACETRLRQLEEQARAGQAALEQARRAQRRLEQEAAEFAQRHQAQQQAAPWVTEFHKHREAGRAAAHAWERESRTLAELERQQSQLEQAGIAPEALAARQAGLDTAREQHGYAVAALREVEKQWQRFESVGEASDCPWCGQELLPEHRAQETARLQQELQSAQALLESRTQQLAQAQTVCRELQQRQQDWEQQQRQLAKQISEARLHSSHARTQRQLADEHVLNAWRQLPVELQQLISPSVPDDWTATTWPTRDDLADYQRGLQELHQQSAALSGQLAAETRELTRAESRVEELRQQQPVAQKELSQLFHELTKIRSQHSAREHLQALAWQRLPEPWQTWDAETASRQSRSLPDRLQQLAAGNVVQRHEQLAQCRLRLEYLREQRAGLEQKTASLPAPARRAPGLLEGELKQIREQREATATTLRETQWTVTRLRQQQAERTDLEGKYLAADRRRHLWDRLAHLLSRTGLQRALVRAAELQITQYANQTLDRLSGGTMHLDLTPPADDGEETALNLQVTTDASAQPLNVSFLSGSQKFRVSVALALAIGQYASRHSRPVQSVIIDEGFGCLDSERRQVMIAEIQSLRDHLQRIILVSHQEEFSDAFPTGYKVELDDTGTSRLTRFDR